MSGNLRFFRRILGLVILALSSVVFLWGNWPLPENSEYLSIPPDRRMVLVWPDTARIGDAQFVRMRIEPEPELQTTGPQPGVVGSNVLAAARLEFAGLQFFPGDAASQPLRKGMPLTFRWDFRPEARGDFTGVAWLYLHEVPHNGDPETVTPVTAREIHIHAADLFGLSGPSARLLGGFGFLVGGLLVIDVVFAWLKKQIWRQTSLQPSSEFAEQ